MIEIQDLEGVQKKEVLLRRANIKKKKKKKSVPKNDYLLKKRLETTLGNKNRINKKRSGTDTILGTIYM